MEELKHLDVKKLWQILKRLKPEQLKVLKAEAADILAQYKRSQSKLFAGAGERNITDREWQSISLAYARAVTATSESLCVNPNATCRYKRSMVTACAVSIDSRGL